MVPVLVGDADVGRAGRPGARNWCGGAGAEPDFISRPYVTRYTVIIRAPEAVMTPAAAC